MTDIAVTRRFVKKDYFESNSGFMGGTPANVGRERHWECGRLTLSDAEDDHDIVITFAEPFPYGTIPVGFGCGLAVYKFIADGTEWIKQDVLYKVKENPSPHTEFLITIDGDESLDWVIVEYMFTE